MEMLSIIAAWDGLGVVVRHDRPTGAWIFIALHDDTLGRPTGGTRLWVYPTPADGLRDALRLAEGMTSKWAAVGIDFGGGKAVLALPGPIEGEARRGLLRRYGRLVHSLHGSFSTGEDLGTTPEDMAEIAAEAPWVMGGAGPDGLPLDPGPFTARCVFRGAVAAVRHAFRRRRPGRPYRPRPGAGRRRRSARPAPRRRRRPPAGERPRRRRGSRPSPRELGDATVQAVPPEAVYDTPCDVFAPCAIGGVLNRETIPRLPAGWWPARPTTSSPRRPTPSASTSGGILYAPDYVINGGGALSFGLMEQGETDPRPPLCPGRGARRLARRDLPRSRRARRVALRTSQRRVRQALARGPAAG